MPITRRAFAAAAVAQLALVPRRARGQPSKMARIGVLLYGTPDNDPNLPAFRDGMRDLGYVEGRNLVYEYRYAEAKTERLAGLATELVKHGPHLIFALGGDVAPFAWTNLREVVGLRCVPAFMPSLQERRRLSGDQPRLTELCGRGDEDRQIDEIRQFRPG